MSKLDSELEETKLQFHYLKSNDYREVPCHGILGGVGPGGRIWFCMYNERGPIPRIVEYPVRANKQGLVEGFDEKNTAPSFVDVRQGIVRNVEVGAFLDVEVAERMYVWLGERIAEAKAVPK